MTVPPSMPSSALRGAVDLSSLGQRPPTPRPGGSPGSPAGAGAGAGPGGGGARVDGTDATFQQLMLGTQEVAAVVVLWSAAHPETEQAVTNAVAVAEGLGGRLRVIAVDIGANPGIAGAFQAQQIPVTVGVVAAQPVPLFPGVQPVEQMTALFTEFLRVAAENGVTGAFDLAATGSPGEPEPPPLSPEHEAAYDAIERGDLPAARAAYEAALKLNPKDADATAGLAQVGLLQRTAGVDPAAARAAAAAAPDDVDAQLLAADLDILGGHVEDAFARVLDVVRGTSEDERERARRHLLDLFEIVGAGDDRVGKARRALMSALF